MPNTYLTPSASRHSTNTSEARRSLTKRVSPSAIPMQRTTALAAALFVLACASAQAASRFVIHGAGFGHGVGMSQYGADGYAQHGKDYRFILGHYFTGTEVTPLGSNPTVRVLLETGSGTSFSGAS